jgi:hypothetical protein
VRGEDNNVATPLLRGLQDLFCDISVLNQALNDPCEVCGQALSHFCFQHFLRLAGLGRNLSKFADSGHRHRSNVQENDLGAVVSRQRACNRQGGLSVKRKIRRTKDVCDANHHTVPVFLGVMANTEA